MTNKTLADKIIDRVERPTKTETRISIVKISEQLEVTNDTLNKMSKQLEEISDKLSRLSNYLGTIG